jgi:acyl carrier protein
MIDLLFDQVRQIAADIFDVPLEQVMAESSPNTIDTWDSLQHANLVLALEQSFGLEIVPEEFDEMLNVESIVALVQRKLSQVS